MKWRLFVILQEPDGPRRYPVCMVGGHWVASKNWSVIQGWDIGNVCGALHRTYDVVRIEVEPA